MSNINFERIMSQIKQKIEAMNLKDKWAQLKQKIEDMNLKDKWSTFKLKLDQLPIPKWLLIIITFISVIVAIVSLVSKGSNNIEDGVYIVENEYDPSEEYNEIVEEYALKASRLIDLLYDIKHSDNPFAYTKQIETTAAECVKLKGKLDSAPLNSRQRMYVDEIEGELEDEMRRLQWN
ncbi:MAG: hypothetical protein IKU96_01885 [Alistipes sp.]|nr:hypothetical protein [Alistipes sp.]